MTEYKSALSEFKAEGDEGVVEGLFSVFGNIDDGNDIIHRGAFTKTIQERGNRIKVFLGHDFTKLIAPPPEVLQETDAGLFAKFRIVLESFFGNEAWQLIKAGALTEGSIGFEPVAGKVDFTEGIRNLREVKLFEISPVPLGMNPLTSIQAVKGLFKGAPSNCDGEIELEVLKALNKRIEDGLSFFTAKPQQRKQLRDELLALAEMLEEKRRKPDNHLRLQLQARAAQIALMQTITQ